MTQEHTYTFKVYQDNELKATFEHQTNDFEPFKYLLRHQGQSTNYALKYGGWKVEEINEQTNELTKWNPYA
jgi:hypothetical protein